MCKRYNIVAPIERAVIFSNLPNLPSLAINALAQLQKRRMDERIVPWLTSGAFEGLVCIGMKVWMIMIDYLCMLINMSM